MDSKSVRKIRQALDTLAKPQGAVPVDALASLADLQSTGHRLTIDMSASDELGAPLIIARPSKDHDLRILTPRQREVAQLVIAGHSNKEIARQLGLAVSTVKDHVHAILSRLGCSSRTQLIASVASP